jgi:hypothetical protein
MSELERYKNLYNQLISNLVELHNANIAFLKGPSVRNAWTVRRILRELKSIEKEMWWASMNTTKEAARLRGRGRPKKEKQNVDTK